MENPLRNRERTMQDLMAEMKARLGFVTQGSSSKLIDPILKSFLQEANDYCYERLGKIPHKRRTVIKTHNGERLYDFHNDIDDEDIDPNNVLSVSVYDTDTSLYQLNQGITEQNRCDDITRDFPRRYDVLDGQLEIYPTPDKEYDLVVIYEQGKSRFDRDTDRTSAPSRLVFLYALASAKAHFNHKDATTAGGIFKELLAQYLSNQHMNKRYTTVHPERESALYVKRTEDDKYVI